MPIRLFSSTRPTTCFRLSRKTFTVWPTVMRSLLPWRLRKPTARTSRRWLLSFPLSDLLLTTKGADTIRDVGQYVAVTDDQGRQQNGKIIRKTATELTVDMNHAMVDKDLHFQGKILRVRPASVDEIIQKTIHHARWYPFLVARRLPTCDFLS